MRKLCFIFLSCFLIALPRGSAADDVATDTLVIKATAGALYGDNGTVFSLHDLVWTVKAEPWKAALGLRIRIAGGGHRNADASRNRYGDVLGRIEATGAGWLQKKWIEQGVAVLKGTDGYSDEQRRELLDAERAARQSKGERSFTGLYSKASDLEASAFRQGFKIVTGRVRSIRKIRGVTYLNFGDDWRQDFTASISSKNLRRFKKNHWKIADLENKWIEVRGQVREYNGPYMNLMFPEQVDILQ